MLRYVVVLRLCDEATPIDFATESPAYLSDVAQGSYITPKACFLCEMVTKVERKVEKKILFAEPQRFYGCDPHGLCPLPKVFDGDLRLRGSVAPRSTNLIVYFDND